MPAGGQNTTSWKRTKNQKEMDRIEIVRLVRRGWSFRRIAVHIGKQYDGGLCHVQIHRDYLKILAEMADDYRANRKFCRVAKLQELEDLKEELRTAWEYASGRFLESVIYQALEIKDECDKNGTVLPTEIKISTKSLPPVDYLVAYLKALGIELDLQGLKSPKKKVDKSQHMAVNFNWDLLASASPSQVVDDIETKIAQVLPIQLPVPPSTTNGEQHTNGTQS